MPSELPSVGEEPWISRLGKYFMWPSSVFLRFITYPEGSRLHELTEQSSTAGSFRNHHMFILHTIHAGGRFQCPGSLITGRKGFVWYLHPQGTQLPVSRHFLSTRNHYQMILRTIRFWPYSAEVKSGPGPLSKLFLVSWVLDIRKGSSEPDTANLYSPQEQDR